MLVPTVVPGHCRYPKWTEDWFVHELGVLCDGLFGHGVNNPIAHFLNVDTVEDAIGKPGKSLWEGIQAVSQMQG